MTHNEVCLIPQNRSGRIKIALVYPNTYHVGMSSLGFQTVYALLNDIDEVACERAFLPADPRARLTTAESGRLLSEFDIIAFSVSFEHDYLNLLTIFEKSDMPPLSRSRNDSHPLIIAGGVACFLNPEPIAPFIDCFLIGEAEGLLPRFFDCIEAFIPESDRRRRGRWPDKRRVLANLARSVAGVYVPEFYRTVCHKDGTPESVEPLLDVPPKIQRVFLKDISGVPAHSAVLTPDTTFSQTFLMEVSRGCPHGCRFCSAGYVYRPPRFMPLSDLRQCLEKGISMTNRIGLVGAAVSDHPDIVELCRGTEENIHFGFSSLRADALDSGLVSVLNRGGVKTATIAPDAGSEHMRRVINKGITESDILNASELLVSKDIPNLKLYFMTGLPTESEDDAEAIADLCRRIKQRFLASSRIKKRIGEITVSLNCFVPKPFTPFQWAPMDETRILKQKIKQVKNGLKRVPNVRFQADMPRQAHIQALLSRGDRRIADLLLLAHQNKGNWPQTLKESSLNTDDYIYRTRGFDEYLPWDIIDHGIRKDFLEREYKRGIQGKPSPPCKMDTSCKICGVC